LGFNNVFVILVILTAVTTLSLWYKYYIWHYAYYREMNLKNCNLKVESHDLINKSLYVNKYALFYYQSNCSENKFKSWGFLFLPEEMNVKKATKKQK